MKATNAVLLITALFLGSGPAIAHGPDRDRGHHQPGPGQHGPEPMEIIGHLHRALKRLDLEPGQREAIRAHFQDMKRDVGPLLGQLREGRQALHELLLAADYDSDAINAIAERQGSVNGQLIAMVARTVHSALSELTPEQRAELHALGEKHRAQMSKRVEHLQQRLDAPPGDDA